MAKVGVTGRDTAGGMVLPTSTHVKVNGRPVALHGDVVAAHGNPPHSPAPTLIASRNIKVNGVPIAITGDSATCGHTLSGTSHLNVN